MGAISSRARADNAVEIAIFIMTESAQKIP
jgi:hypothetical protein